MTPPERRKDHIQFHERKVTAIVLLLLALSLSGYAQVVTPVEGESWAGAPPPGV